MSLIRDWLVTLVVFLAIDMVWLNILAKDIYRQQIGSLLAARPNLVAALVFYALYIVGLLFFVIHPALAKSSWREALFTGMLFGFVTYMTYDLTNLATMEGWPWRLTVIDMAWGTALGGSVSLISYFLLGLFR